MSSLESSRKCRQHHPPYAAQALMPDGSVVTVTPDEQAQTRFRESEDVCRLSVIQILGTEDNQQTLERFLDWAGAQPEPDKPVHIQSFQIKDGLTAAAYTTGRRIRENGWFDEEDVQAIRQIIREECESFGRSERGEVYKADIRRPCIQCGHPEAGDPIYEEAGIEGPPEEAIKLMRELIRHNMVGL